MFERILLVLDGSKHAELAIPYAENLTRFLNSHLFVLHLKKRADEDNAYTNEVVSQIASAMGQVKPKTAEAVGEAASGIINYAEQNRVGLIVMTTRSRTGILLWPTGNIANRVIEGVTMPLISIKVPGTPAPQIESMMARIVVPLDGSKAGEAALPYAAELSHKLGSELHLINVVEPGAGGTYYVKAGGFSYVDPGETDKSKDEFERYLATVKESLGGADNIKTEVRAGIPALEISRFAEEVSAQLIALSSTGNKGAFGSVFRRTMQSARCHIMAVHPKQ